MVVVEDPDSFQVLVVTFWGCVWPDRGRHQRPKPCFPHHPEVRPGPAPPGSQTEAIWVVAHLPRFVAVARRAEGQCAAELLAARHLDGSGVGVVPDGRLHVQVGGEAHHHGEGYEGHRGLQAVGLEDLLDARAPACAEAAASLAVKGLVDGTLPYEDAARGDHDVVVDVVGRRYIFNLLARPMEERLLLLANVEQGVSTGHIVRLALELPDHVVQLIHPSLH
mmetsp:Transcript_134680/g.375354  ORF Transcript_134680/g.375354 Transcript_134680/m.375354 type:complete len:222 (-) Transcript_134680:488-1153(-)